MDSIRKNHSLRVVLSICLGIGLIIGLASGSAAARPAESEIVHAPGDDDWQAGFSAAGMSGAVKALAVDSANGDVYAGGNFFFAGEEEVFYVARYDGSGWHALKSGLSSHVYALALDSQGNLYTAGLFTTTSSGGPQLKRIARWDGSDWFPLGSGVTGTINALAVDHNDKLYAAGAITDAGGVGVLNIAKWDASANGGAGAWSALGSGLTGTVYALAVDSQNRVYAGGNITNAGGVSVQNLARWDPAANGGAGAWSGVGGGVSGGVITSLLVDNNGDLIAGGNFFSAGGAPAARIAKWNGASWTALATQSDGGVLALAVDSSNNIYAGGFFTSINNTSYARVAVWNGSTWSTLSNGMDGTVYALAWQGPSKLFAGGDFLQADSRPANFVAYYENDAWYVTGLPGYGANDGVDDLLVDNQGRLYAGGWYDQIGPLKTQTFARWDGNSWQELGGLGGTVYAMVAQPNGMLYVGGTFGSIGNITANYIARFDPAANGGAGAWFALGNGLDDWVIDLAMDSAGRVYAAGYFSSASGIPTGHVAMWDPLSKGGAGAWKSLGSGIDTSVWAVEVDSQDRLYAGGTFQNAGGGSASNIAMWDPAANGGLGAWSALGSGVDAPVYDLEMDNQGRLLVGGSFNDAGGQQSPNLARWDPAANGGAGAWSAWPVALNGGVNELVSASDGSLFVVGDFTAAGNQQLNYIARWNGAAWEPLGSGLNYHAYDLVLVGPRELYVSGHFTRAGDKPSHFIAHWVGKPPVFLPVIMR